MAILVCVVGNDHFVIQVLLSLVTMTRLNLAPARPFFTHMQSSGGKNAAPDHNPDCSFTSEIVDFPVRRRLLCNSVQVSKNSRVYEKKLSVSRCT